jgi:hypothetical protein
MNVNRYTRVARSSAIFRWVDGQLHHIATANSVHWANSADCGA